MQNTKAVTAVLTCVGGSCHGKDIAFFFVRNYGQGNNSFFSPVE